MSIEQAIVGLTAAIEKYTATIEKAMVSDIPPIAKAEAPAKAAKAEAPAKAAKTAPAKAAAAAPSEGLEEVKALTTKAIKDAGLASEVKEVIAGYGVKKASDLPEKHWAEYIAKVNGLMNGGVDTEDEEDDLI